jgi:succinoglycan biosynthesis transport protein ExoP
MNQHKLSFHKALPKLEEDRDSFIDLDRLLAILLRRAGTIAAAVGIFAALAAVYLIFATPIYTASTQILLDDELAKYAEDAPPQANAQILDNKMSNAIEILQSNELALRVVDQLNLGENDLILNPPQSPVALVKSGLKTIVSALTPQGPLPSETDIRQANRQKAAAMLQRALTAERQSRSSVIAVSFQSSDRQLATAVTRAYAQAFLSDQLNANFEATEQASLWLQGRLDDLRKRSQEAALEVEKYRADNGLTSARGELMSESQLADLNRQLILAQADTASASARYTQYKSIVDKGPDAAIQNATISSDQIGNSTIRDLKTRYLAVSKREQEITQDFGADHPQAVALRAEKQDITRQIYQELQQLTSSYRNEYEVARSREASLRENINRLTGKNSEANKSLVHLDELDQKARALKGLYESYLGRYEEASQKQTFPIAKARVISAAGLPTAPSSPKKTMTLALGIVLGLLVGGAFAAFQEFRERFFRVESDVRSILGLKFLGYLPLVAKPPAAKAKRKGDPVAAEEEGATSFERIMRMVVEAPRSAFAETLRNAKLASDVLLQGRADRVIGVISALPGEGKSVTAANFAALLASSGKRTLLIDADLRNPGLTRMLNVPPQQGLIEAVLGEIPWANAVKIDRSTKLAILPVIQRDNLIHTAELLSSQGMANLMENARKMFDYIVVDLAPLGAVVDAKAFEPQVDGFLLVAEWGVTPTGIVRDILDAEPQINAKTLGVILNKTDMTVLRKYSNFGGTERHRHKYVSYYVDDEEKVAANA